MFYAVVDVWMISTTNPATWREYSPGLILNWNFWSGSAVEENRTLELTLNDRRAVYVLPGLAL
jgi:hypothetical protein